MTEIDYNEAQTRTRYITPKIVEAGWDNQPHTFREEVTFTDVTLPQFGGQQKCPID